MKLKLGLRIWKNKPKAVLFDMDGVLIDSASLWHESFNRTLKKFGSKNVSKPDFIKKYWGRSVEENIKSFRNDFKNRKLDEEAVKFCKKQFGEICVKSKMFPGTRKVLGSIKRSFKTALVTNTPRHEVFEILKRFGIEKYFDVVVSIDDVKNGKPDPEAVKKACKVLGAMPGRAVFIGDTLSDFMAGKSAGCRVIGMKMDADERIEKISELPKKLGLKV